MLRTVTNYILNGIKHVLMKVMGNSRAVSSVGGGGGVWVALAPSVFGRTGNAISTWGADYAHHSTSSPPPDFQTLQRP